MIRSMTGYGKAEVTAGSAVITAEARSVNHRYGEVAVKLPRNLLHLENDIRKAAARLVKRGKMDLFVQQHCELDTAGHPQPDLNLARAYREAFLQIKQELSLTGEVTLEMVATQRDVVARSEQVQDSDDATLDAAVLEAVQGAVALLDAMRQREGTALLEDLLDRRGTVAKLMERVRKRAPVVIEEHQRKLRERLLKMLGDAAPDDARLLQEVALLCDRCDVTEEIVRFGSHLQQFDETLTCGEPVGRKLDFIIQEMNREVNTIGSKANDAELAAVVVELKTEMEKIREQIQNIE